MIFNIIIVDDEFYALKAIETALKWDEIGIKEVYTAANIKQAKDILTTRDIHIMLCDIEMPQGNGLELLSWIKERNPAIKCIFITCHAEFNYAQKAVELGAMEYILKPVSKEKLTEIVRKAIRDIKSEKNLIENSEYGKLWLENMAVVVERFWLDVIEKKIPPVPEKIEKEAKRRGITHNRTEKYLPIFISMQKNDSKDDLQIINNYLRNKAKEVILNEIKNNSGYIIQFYHDILLLINDNSINYGNLKKCCESYIETSCNHLGVDLTCYIGTGVFAHELSNAVNKLLDFKVNNVGYNKQIIFLEEDFQLSQNNIIAMFEDNFNEEGISAPVKKVKECIENFGVQITCKEIAEYVGYHPDYLNRIFKEEIGYTISEYLLNERLRTAKSMLVKTNMQISSISLNIGYSNFSYFSKIFKDYTGLSPAEFRRKMRVVDL